MRVPLVKALCKAALGMICCAAVVGQPGPAQTVAGNEVTEQVLGSVQVGENVVKLFIAYSGDAAVLDFSVTDGRRPEMFVPMFATTYRGMPPVVLDVYASRANDEIWVQSSWPGSEVLAYHRLGAATALTAYGEVTLLATAFPEFLSGGPVPFPEIDPAKVSRRATFYHVAEP